MLPGVLEATERIWNAVQQKRPICIYGDYDVDGVTGTSILLTALKHLGAVVEFHVPHRLEDGYGLNGPALARLAEQGVKTVITVDCGIASMAEADLARRLGLELIITDHHEFKDTLPSADVLVHPRLPIGHNGSAVHYPFGGLSGAGRRFQAGLGPVQEGVRLGEGDAAAARVPARRHRAGGHGHRGRRRAALR